MKKFLTLICVFYLFGSPAAFAQNSAALPQVSNNHIALTEDIVRGIGGEKAMANLDEVYLNDGLILYPLDTLYNVDSSSGKWGQLVVSHPDTIVIPASRPGVIVIESGTIFAKFDSVKLKLPIALCLDGLYRVYLKRAYSGQWYPLVLNGVNYTGYFTPSFLVVDPKKVKGKVKLAIGLSHRDAYFGSKGAPGKKTVPQQFEYKKAQPPPKADGSDKKKTGTTPSK